MVVATSHRWCLVFDVDIQFSRFEFIFIFPAKVKTVEPYM